jgi:hypothetical protein
MTICPLEQGLKAGGATKNGQCPLAYPCSSEVQNRHAERHVERMAPWNVDELTDDVQGNGAVGVLVPARNFAEDVPRSGAAGGVDRSPSGTHYEAHEPLLRLECAHCYGNLRVVVELLG